MKKSKFLMVLAMLCLNLFVFGFTACQNKGKDEEPLSPVEPEVKTTFSYRIEGQGGYITGAEIVNNEVIFPESIDGYSILGIDDNAFKNNTLIKSITIPNSYSSIGLGSFYNCSNLKKVYLPLDLVDVGENAFGEDYAIEYVAIGKLIEHTEELNASKILNSVHELKVLEGVTNLESEACSSLGALTKVILPESLLSVGDACFKACVSLAEINLPSKITSVPDSLFEGCVNLTQLTINGDVSNIGEKAFYYSGIESITIDEDVEVIKASTFESCFALESVNILSESFTIEENAFKNCTALLQIDLSACIEMGESTFEACSNLESIVLGECIESIPTKAFFNCKKISNIQLPGGIKSLDSYCFNGCEKLEKIVIPSEIQSIGIYAFGNALNLQSIEIKAQSIEYGGGIFENCRNILSVNILSNKDDFIQNNKYDFETLVNLEDVVRLFNYTDDTSIIFADTEEPVEIVNEGSVYRELESGLRLIKLNSELENVVIPNQIDGKNIVSIGNYAVSSNDKLTQITLPSNLLEIGSYAFYGCAKLTNITCPDGLQIIKNRAFEKCTSLENVLLNEKITSIGDYAFYECVSLSSIIVPESVDDLGEGVFRLCSNLQVATINAELTELSHYIFANCESLTQVSLSEGIEYIGVHAFLQCTNLELISLPISLTQIDYYAFEQCEKLTQIEVGENIEYLGEKFLKDCNLTQVKINLTREQFCAQCTYGLTSQKIIDTDQYLTMVFNVSNITFIIFNEI